MPPKRPYDQTQEFTTSTQAKRLKLKDARTIAFQPVAGPSHTSGKSAIVNSMKGLPTQLDVEKFVQSRSFEIQSMEQAMKAAKSSTTHRAWQELPRHLRRRAASHDVRRVPQRLRDKSRKEIDAMKRKALGRARPKRGKKNEIPRVVTLLKRQKNKKWLETHLWHAKRMKMANMWGYRLAVQPTEKSFRPSHRASVHGSILHDASYESFIELVGEEPVLEHILLACCDPQGSHPSSLRFKSGVRMCETAIYGLGDYPIGLIGPVSLVWRPFIASKPSPESQAQTQQQNLSKRKRKKITGKKPTAEVLPGCPRRTLWIRCHPLIHDEVLKTLKLAASRALEALKVVPEHTKKEYTVEVADLSSSVNIFELTGPKSSQIIHGALSPVFEDASVEFREFWSQLAKVQSAGSVPSGMVVSFTINDLRLSFPPKNTKVRINEDALPSMPQVWTCTPSEILANGQGDIWNTGLRMKVPSYTKRGLDLRRAQNTVPGTRLTPKPSDDKIPVMLIQRSVGPPSHSSSSTPEANLHGWTLIIPKFWSMAFLSSLVYTGTRVGGQRERAHQSFEACAPHFPRDFPLCAAYDQFAKERADEEKGRWERKPPAKRASWEVLGTRSPWMPDWAVVLGGKPSAKASSAVEGENDDEHDLVEAQRLPTSETEEAVNPWLLRGPDVRKVLDDTAGMLNPAPALWSYIDKLRRKRGMDSLPVGGDAIERLMRGALLRVKLMLVERGKPEDVAVIYDVPDREIGEWKKTVVEKRRLEKFGSVQDSADGDVEVEGEEQQDDRLGSRPKRDDIVGYVTSGNYSLLRGQAYGIGAMPVAVFLQLKERAIRFRLDNPLVKVRNRDGLIARYAYVDVLEG